MLLQKTLYPTPHLTQLETESNARRFRVYHVCLNGEVRRVVPAWRLFEFLRGLKVLNVYGKIGALEEGNLFESSAYVHGAPLHLAVRVAEWIIFSNSAQPALRTFPSERKLHSI